MRSGGIAFGETQHQLATVRGVICDIDHTLTHPSDSTFFRQYGAAVEHAIADYFGIGTNFARVIAIYYRQEYDGGEQALLRGDVGDHFPGIESRPPDHTMLYDRMAEIDPRGKFTRQDETRDALAGMRRLGVRVAALTSSPDVVSRQILHESGFDPDADFDLFMPFTRERGPLKKIEGSGVFSDIANQLGTTPDTILVVGDELRQDVQPALGLGMQGVLLCTERPAGYNGMIAQNVLQVFAEVTEAVSSGIS